MLKEYKIDVHSFTADDVRIVNEKFKNSHKCANGCKNPRLLERIKSDFSREKINSAWKNAVNSD